MTLNELYQKGCSLLKEKHIEDAEFDAHCLIEHSLNITPTEYFMRRGEAVDITTENRYYDYLQRRINGEPLQYIIGKWEFMGNEFYVGDGVLIPRPETEILVEKAVDYLKHKKKPVVFDICSGTGCIAISIAKIFPDAKVYAVEKYAKAYSYLLQNIDLNAVGNVKAVNGDLFDKDLLKGISPDVILSNPPYIRTDDIEKLDITVRNEPHTALDGGNDGYVFYRFLSDYWFSDRLKQDSVMILECGEDQGDAIASMLSTNSKKVKVIEDFNKMQRIVIAEK